MPENNPFETLPAVLQSQGVDSALQLLADHLRNSGQFHELFEVLKMQLRRRLGLPMIYSDNGDNLPEEQRNRLEEGLLVACKDVGLALLDRGLIRQGWMYLRPVGDRQLVAGVLQKIEPDEDNTEEMVEVLLHEGVDAGRGYALVLKNYGTCNAITTFDSVVARLPRRDQQAAAGQLVRHVHHELMLSLRADIARQEGTEPREQSIGGLVADRPWLFSEFSYHLDTTHLAATVRVSRLLEDPELLRQALDLTEYGRRLSSQFQYKGDEPFLDIYPSNALYLSALLGSNVDEAVDYFRNKAETLPVYDHGPGPVEAYVQLLSRIGRHGDAVRELIRLIPDDARPSGFSGLLLELSQAAQDYGPLIEYCRSHQDLLGFATGLLQSLGRV